MSTQIKPFIAGAVASTLFIKAVPHLPDPKPMTVIAGAVFIYPLVSLCATKTLIYGTFGFYSMICAYIIRKTCI